MSYGGALACLLLLTLWSPANPVVQRLGWLAGLTALPLLGWLAWKTRDITEHKRAEEELRTSEARLNEAQRLAHLGSWELDLTRDALFWSDEIYRIFEIDSVHFGASYEAFLNLVHPEDRATVNAAYLDSVKSKTPYEITHRLLMSDGRIKYVHERCETFYDDNGVPLRSIGTVQDVTERKTAEQRLWDSHHLLQSIIRTAPVRVFWKDRDSRYLGCNQLFAGDAGQASPEDLVGKDDFQLVWKEQAALYRADDRRVMESGVPKLDFEEPQTTPDGCLIWLRTSKVPLHNEAGEVIGILGVYEDVTERKRAEEALRQSVERFEMVVRGSLDGLWDASVNVHDPLNPDNPIY